MHTGSFENVVLGAVEEAVGRCRGDHRIGAVVHVDNRQRGLATRPAVEEVRRRHLGPDRRAGQGIRNTSPGDEDDVFRAAGFAGPEVVVVPDGRRVERSPEDVLHEILSSSGTAPHLFGDRLDDFVADVRAVLPPVTMVVLPDNELTVWRPASASRRGC